MNAVSLVSCVGLIRHQHTRHAVPDRTISLCGLIAFAYIGVCGGPFGLEGAVQAGGALLTLVGIGVISVAWALPQALITAEMATAFPINGGSVEVCACLRCYY